MSVALSEARALDGCLAAGDDDLAKRFFREVARIVASPWAIARGRTIAIPRSKAAAHRDTACGRYMERAHRAATRDPVVLRRFFEVASLLAPPPAMMAPGIAWRVLLGGRAVGETGPAHKVA